MAPHRPVLQQHRRGAVGPRRPQQQTGRAIPAPVDGRRCRISPSRHRRHARFRICRRSDRAQSRRPPPIRRNILLEFAYTSSCRELWTPRDEGRADVTVELAHPSTEPLGSRSPAEPAHPRWWFISTTPGRILTIGIVLAALGVSSAFATSTTINHRQQVLTTVLNHTEPLSFAAGRLYTTLSVADAAAATAFIAQAEPRAVRQRYEQAITDAAVARDPGVQRADRRTAGAIAGPDQRRTGRLYRADRNRADQQPGRQPGRLVVSVRGVGADAVDRSCPTRQQLYQADVRAGGRRNHRVHAYSRPR